MSTDNSNPSSTDSSYFRSLREKAWRFVRKNYRKVDASNAAQEVALRAFQYKETNGTRPHWGWLVTVMKNLIGELVRGMKSQKRNQSREVSGREDTLVDSGPSPSSAAVRKEAIQVVNEVVADLPSGARAVVERKLDGKSNGTIAQELATTPGAVNTSYGRATREMASNPKLKDYVNDMPHLAASLSLEERIIQLYYSHRKRVPTIADHLKITKDDVYACLGKHEEAIRDKT